MVYRLLIAHVGEKIQKLSAFSQQVLVSHLSISALFHLINSLIIQAAMNTRWRLLIVSIFSLFLFTPYSLLARGQSEFSSPDEGNGILLIQIRSHRGIRQEWTRRLHYRNIDTDTRHRITWSARPQTMLIDLPPGRYILESVDRLRNGNTEERNESFDPPQSGFQITPGTITPFPFMIFYYYTGLPDSQAFLASLPSEMASYNAHPIVHTDGSFRSAFYLLSANPNLERELIDEIKAIPGTEAWIYHAKHSQNLAYWLGNEAFLSHQSTPETASSPEPPATPQSEPLRRFAPIGNAHIAFLQIENQTNQTEYDALAQTVQSAVIADLLTVNNFEVIEISDKLESSLAEQALRLEVDALMWGSVYMTDDFTITVTLSLYDRLKDELLISKSGVSSGVLDVFRVTDELVAGVIQVVNTEK